MRKIGRALTPATLLLLFTVVPSTPALALPPQCLSPKYDQLIGTAVDQYWRDFPKREWAKAQLCQESQLDPNAVSPVGAQGLGQVMPRTYTDISRALHWDSAASAFDPERAITAFAYYQGNSRRMWGAEGRSGEQRNQLGLCNYNAGAGSCLKAQALCNGARLWENISPCLAGITGGLSKQTIDYVKNITRFSEEFSTLNRR